MVHASKRKGDGFEREVVKILQAHGLAAEKTPLSGAVKGGRFEQDITCPVRGVDWNIECKRRKREFATIDGYLGDNDALVARDDRTRPLVIMTLERFCKLAI